MKRRDFFGLALASLLLVGCASNSLYLHYIVENKTEIDSIKKQYGDNIIKVKYDSQNHYYIVTIRDKK